MKLLFLLLLMTMIIALSLLAKPGRRRWSERPSLEAVMATFAAFFRQRKLVKRA